MYSNKYNNEYSDEYSSLDRQARLINNKRKEMRRNVKINKDSFESDMIRGIDASYNDTTFNFLPVGNIYKKKGDFVSGLPTSFDEKSSDSKLSEASELQSKNSVDESMERSFIINSETDLTSTYSILPKKVKKQLRMNTDHLKRYTDNDEKEVLGHLNKCDDCKQQLLKLLKGENHVFPNINTDKSDKKEKKEDKVKEEKEEEKKCETEGSLIGLNYKEIRDIIILIMIGVIIIVFADIFLRRN
jgi:hypothetical protein